MKSFSLLAIFISLFSCSQESDTITNGKAEAAAHRESNGSPVNSQNPYDNSGQLFGTLFDVYYAEDTLPTTTPEIVNRVEQLAADNANFVALKTAAYQPASPARIDYLLTHPATCVSDMLLASQLSGKGRSFLNVFINTVVPLCAASEEYEPVYDYISDFEDLTLADPTLTAKDKQVILTTASIARYSAYKARKKPKKRNDPEWDTLITHVTAGAEGADRGACEAVAMALATGIAGN